MAYLIIDPTELTAGKPVTSNLMQRIVNNIDDVNGRAEGTETQIVSANNSIAVRNSTLIQFADTSAGGFTTTLPLASDMLNKTLIFKKISTDNNAWTIEGAGSDTIEGQLNYVLTTQNQVVYIVSDGTYWWKISDIDASGQVAQSRAINTTAPLTGGGNLTADRTLALVLADGSIYIGNSSNVPVARAVTGDITISNTGVTSIATGSIVNSDISGSAAIDVAKISINGNIVGDANNLRDLGSDGVEFKDLFTHNVKHGDAANPNLLITTTSNNGNIQLTPHGTGTVISASKITAPTLQMTIGASIGYLLQSDASGNASWVAPPSGTSLAGLIDVNLGSPTQYQVLQYDGVSDWINALIGTNSISNSAVTADKIANGTITNVKIADANITLSKMATTSANRLIVTDATGALVAHGALTANRLLRTDANGIPVSLSGIATNRALVSDSSGYPSASSVTSTELGYLSGATSNIQGQISSISTSTNDRFLPSDQISGSNNYGSVAAGVTNANTGAPGVFSQGTWVLTIRITSANLTETSVSTRQVLVERGAGATSTLSQLGVVNSTNGTLTVASSVTLSVNSAGQLLFTHPASPNTTCSFKWLAYQML